VACARQLDRLTSGTARLPWQVVRNVRSSRKVLTSGSVRGTELLENPAVDTIGRVFRDRGVGAALRKSDTGNSASD
jgi:hypothetical protein